MGGGGGGGGGGLCVACTILCSCLFFLPDMIFEETQKRKHVSVRVGHVASVWLSPPSSIPDTGKMNLPLLISYPNNNLINLL